jgi:hypothetical protein
VVVNVPYVLPAPPPRVTPHFRALRHTRRSETTLFPLRLLTSANARLDIQSPQYRARVPPGMRPPRPS